VKFKDAELLGVPWIVVVGRGWAQRTVELRNRFSGEVRELAVGAGLATDITVAVSRNQI
jgi:prolyl-tRNA synthetase